MQGDIALDYDQNAGRIQLGSSEISLRSTHLGVSGTLGQNLAIHLTTSDLNDLLTVFSLLDETPPEKLPIALHGGQLRFDGNVSGSLSDLRVTGKADITHVALNRREFDHVTATVDMNRSIANLNALTAEQGKMHAEGQGRVALRDWKLEEASAISALISVQGADLQKLAAENGIALAVTGTAFGTLQVSGRLIRRC